MTYKWNGWSPAPGIDTSIVLFGGKINMFSDGKKSDGFDAPLKIWSNAGTVGET